MSEPTQEHTGLLLVVDDNEMNRDLLSRRLIKRGHDVLTASDGYEALAVIKEKKIDVVLLDVNMPGIDGFETLARIREEHSQSDLCVVMVTAKDSSEDIVKALKLGANDYVTKPIDFPVAHARVQTQLVMKRSFEHIQRLERKLVKQNEHLEDANKRMRRDLEAAALVQKAGLPQVPPEVSNLRFAWSYHPCEELGGDSLNIFRIDERYIAAYVLDVSGHGVPAALLSVTVNRHLKPQLDGHSPVMRVHPEPPGYSITQPASLAASLNRSYPIDWDLKQYFTILYGLFDTLERKFCFVGAGHPGPILVRAGTEPPVICDSPGYPIGIIEEASYDERTIELQPGDRLYLYSDGLIEQRNADDAMFNRKMLLALMDRIRSLPLEESVTAMMDEVRRWTSPTPPDDDLTVVAIEVV
ncbi:MAG: fused response regulator/phosphatase [Phycisphaeraceae bacterium]